MSTEIYKVIEKKDKDVSFFYVERPDGSIVNETKFKTFKEANKKLETLIAMQYCYGR